eukprot:525208-Alexandrium_andersonii.AAC.1
MDAFEATCPLAVGNDGVVESVETAPRTSSTCISKGHIGRAAGSTRGAPPGSAPRRQVWARVAPRPEGSVLEMGRLRDTRGPETDTSPRA